MSEIDYTKYDSSSNSNTIPIPDKYKNFKEIACESGLNNNPKNPLEKIISSKRKDYISRDDMYMTVAFIASLRSKDPNTQVGAVIVSSEDRILSVGYNGFPNGISDDEFPWDRKAEHEEDTKYPYVVHAEANAIMNFRGDNKALQGATLYVTLFPCHECTKMIIQSGIKKIIYKSNKYADTVDYKEAKRMLDAVKIECVQYDINKETSINMAKKIMNYFNF